MTKKQEHLPPDEILRRLDVARELLPEYFRKFLSLEAMKEGPGEPQEQAWQWLAALLVNDDKIFERVEGMVADKKRGRPKSDAEAVKHPPEKLVELADAFDRYEAQLSQDAELRGVSPPNQQKLVASFLGKHACGASRFSWLCTSKGALSYATVIKLIQYGRKMRRWPRREINGRTHILHPAQAAAYKALQSAPLDTDGATAKAANAILSLRHDRKGGIAEIENLQMLYTLRGHAIRTMFGGPPLPLLHRSTKEIRDE
jgi:hypothetical protein